MIHDCTFRSYFSAICYFKLYENLLGPFTAMSSDFGELTSSKVLWVFCRGERRKTYAFGFAGIRIELKSRQASKRILVSGFCIFWK